jgi:hypothetical protein
VTITGLKRVGIDEEFVRQAKAEQEEEFQRAFTLDLSLSFLLAFVIAAAAPFVALDLRRAGAARDAGRAVRQVQPARARLGRAVRRARRPRNPAVNVHSAPL